MGTCPRGTPRFGRRDDERALGHAGSNPLRSRVNEAVGTKANRCTDGTAHDDRCWRRQEGVDSLNRMELAAVTSYMGRCTSLGQAGLVEDDKVYRQARSSSKLILKCHLRLTFPSYFGDRPERPSARAPEPGFFSGCFPGKRKRGGAALLFACWAVWGGRASNRVSRCGHGRVKLHCVDRGPARTAYRFPLPPTELIALALHSDLLH